MRINSMFRVLVFSVMLMTFSMSFPTFAQVTGLQRQAAQEAERHAKADAHTCLWFMTGVIGGFFGYLTAYIYHPPVPTVPLLGKSPEYVAAYTDTYRKISQKRQSRLALYGCVIGTAVGCLSIISYSTGTIQHELSYIF